MGANTGLLQTPFGCVAVTWQDGILTGVVLEPAIAVSERVAVPADIGAQLRAYFEDGSRGFTLAVRLSGTAFQVRVWRALQAIPPGAIVTYGELAQRLGTSARAVGGACRANPCPIVVPCHRVVGKQGLGGFAGDTTGRRLAFKRWLLHHEGASWPRTSRSPLRPVGTSASGALGESKLARGA